MKKAFFMITLFICFNFFTISYGMKWINSKNEFTEDGKKAFKILGLDIPEDPQKAQNFLKNYCYDYNPSFDNFKGFKNMHKIVDSESISYECLNKFLDYIDKHVETRTMKEKDCKNAIAIIPVSYNLDENKSLFDLITPYINVIDGVILFMHIDCKYTPDNTQKLFSETFPDFKKNLDICISEDIGSPFDEAMSDCAKQILKKWKKNNTDPEYFIATIFKPLVDNIKNVLKGNYMGCEVQPFLLQKDALLKKSVTIDQIIWSKLKTASEHKYIP